MGCLCNSINRKPYIIATNNNDIPFKTLYVCAMASKYAYLDVDGFKSCISNVIPIIEDSIYYDGESLTKQREDTQAYLVDTPSIVYIIFRGTEDIQDLLADLDIRKVKLPNNATVHRGFYEQFEAIKIPLTHDIERKRGTKEIMFCGHSLGGALATYAAAYFGNLFKNENIVKCVTFGSPRVGCQKFVKWFESSVSEFWRVTNKKDLITCVPVTRRFTHTSNCLCLNDKLFDVLHDDHKISKRLLKLVSSSIHEHSCDVYIRRLGILNNRTSKDITLP
jgi:hypothetical protein